MSTLAWIIVIAVAVLLLVVLSPAPAFYLFLFTRHQERTAAGADFENNYYTPYAEEMRAAEARLADPSLYERVEVQAPKGVTLCADLYRHGNPRIVLMFHGYMTAPTKNFAIFAERVLAAGYDVLLVHERAHGPSGGKNTGLGLLEWEDVLLWADWASGTAGYPQVALYGMSMGGTSVAYALGGLKNPAVKAAVIDSAYQSPAIQLKAQGKKWHIPGFFLIPTLSVLVWILLRVNLYRPVPDSLRKARIPVTVVHGMADSTVSLKQAKANYDAIPGDKEWLPVEGAEHTLPLIVGGKEVQDRVIAFYDQYLKA